MNTRYILGGLCLLVLWSCGRPVAEFTYSGGKEAPAKVDFQVETKEGVTYEWDFGDGTQSTDSKPSHRYTTSGNYTLHTLTHSYIYKIKIFIIHT